MDKQPMSALIGPDTLDNMTLLGEFLVLHGRGCTASEFAKGKAGISIVLFELARCMENSAFEQHACDLLSESLIAPLSSIEFFHGLSGVGYTLLYLINNGFLDADFDELFGTQHDRISEQLIDPNRTAEPCELLYMLQYSKLKGGVPEWGIASYRASRKTILRYRKDSTKKHLELCAAST